MYKCMAGKEMVSTWGDKQMGLEMWVWSRL